MSMAAAATQARDVTTDIPEENLKVNIQYLNNLLGPHVSMAKVSKTLIRFTKPDQVAFFLDSCSWPTGPKAVGVNNALLSRVKFVQDASALHLIKSVREKYLRDIVSQVMEQAFSNQEWGAKAIALAGLWSGDLAEPNFCCEAVVNRSTMVHELVTFILAVQHLATLKLLLLLVKEELTGLGSADNWATTLVQSLMAEAGTHLYPKKPTGGSTVSAPSVVVLVACASGVW